MNIQKNIQMKIKIKIKYININNRIVVKIMNKIFKIKLYKIVYNMNNIRKEFFLKKDK